jgi:hypothetical protein
LIIFLMVDRLLKTHSIKENNIMMRRRAVGRPIARAAVGTAVIAGTAGAVHHHQEKKWAKQAYEDQAVQQMEQQQMAEQYAQQYAPPPPQYAPPPPQYAPPPPQYAPPPAAPAGDDITAKLNQLAQLHASGVLTDEEFAAAKQKLLTS